MKRITISIDFDPTVDSYRQIRSKLSTHFEYEFVQYITERYYGNLSAAARDLKMDRKHLCDLATKHGLRKPKARKPAEPQSINSHEAQSTN